MNHNSKRLRIDIKTPEDFNYIACEIIDKFLERFTYVEYLIREPTQNDINDFGGDEDSIGFIYTQKGMKLYDTFCRRLTKLGKKSFPNKKEEIQVESNTMIFP